MNTFISIAGASTGRVVRPVGILVLAACLCATVGCRTGNKGTQKGDFFTSGSREADQRATQRMARDEQLAGTGESAGEKDVKKAKAGEGVSGDPKGAQAEGKLTLYERLGGESGLTALVEDFTLRAMEDPRVDWTRKGAKRGGLFRSRSETGLWNPTAENVVNLKKHLVQFLSLATGGPVQYDGKEMKSAHSGMRISNPEFDAVIGDLKASLDKLQVPNKEQKELLAIIESTRPQIVSER